jgi:hypothetical protein
MTTKRQENAAKRANLRFARVELPVRLKLAISMSVAATMAV